MSVGKNWRRCWASSACAVSRRCRFQSSPSAEKTPVMPISLNTGSIVPRRRYNFGRLRRMVWLSSGSVMTTTGLWPSGICRACRIHRPTVRGRDGVVSSPVAADCGGRLPLPGLQGPPGRGALYEPAIDDVVGQLDGLEGAPHRQERPRRRDLLRRAPRRKSSCSAGRRASAAGRSTTSTSAAARRRT